jgi:hypothetical protein
MWGGYRVNTKIRHTTLHGDLFVLIYCKLVKFVLL